VDTTSQASILPGSGTFAAFHHRNYRLWFIGQLISLIGTWMQNAAQGFLIYTLTGSPAYLGYVGFVSGLPSWFFMLYGGLIADRVPKRTLLIITQASQMLLAFILAVLVFLNVVQWWHILVLAFLLGVTNAFDFPARQSFIVELVSREDMTNAIAFNATMFNTGAIVGPAFAGIIYALTGPAWCFTLNGISFIAVIIALALMEIKTAPLPTIRQDVAQAIKEGFQYVRADRLILTLVISVFVLNVFGFGLVTLIPAWAVDILHGDVTTNGWLISARGAGAVIGGLSIAALGRRSFRGKMWAFSSFLLPVVMVLFALSRSIPISLFLLAGMGFSLITTLNNSNAMVQSRVPDQLRGRVMGLYSLMLAGGGPIGSLMVGLLAAKTSEPTAALVCAFFLFLFAVAILAFRPEVRNMI
jgi:MFS family permease